MAREQDGDPYCSNCGYSLANLTESSKCPECGRPLVEILARPGVNLRFVRRRSRARLMGLPVLDVAFGPHGSETIGRPRGVIAIGDRPLGVIAVGSLARGGIAVGSVAIGGMAVGGVSLGAAAALGGLAIGGAATGGGAIGGLASGGAAAGVLAQGGGALGWWARGGSAWGQHVISQATGVQSPIAADMFRQFGWFFGSTPMTSATVQQPLLIIAAVTAAAALLAAALALVAWTRNPGWEHTP